MEPRISFVTLVSRDLAAARRFYVDGLGWPVAFEDGVEVVMVSVGERLVLSLWDVASAEQELGPVEFPTQAPQFTLAHNVATRSEVDAVLETARAAGSPTVHAAVQREWGGYSGYFLDPDGVRWEIAFNPGPIGQSVLP